MTQSSSKHPRERAGQYRRKRPWETRRVHTWAVAYAMNGSAAEYVEAFYDGVTALVGDESVFPHDGDLPEGELPGDGVYRFVIGGHIYFLDVDRVFKAAPGSPRWRVRGRLLTGPTTSQGKYPLVALTLAQFRALNPVSQEAHP